MGDTVGSVIPTKGAIIPRRGGCGYRLRHDGRPDQSAREPSADNLHGIREAIEKAVPVGRTDNGGPNDRGVWKDVPGHHLGEWAKLDRSQPHGSTYLGHALESLHESYDRLIVITDEQAHDTMPRPTNNAYMINVASYRNGVGSGAWMHIEGWSESVIG